MKHLEEVAYLESLLQEEFAANPQVRMRRVSVRNIGITVKTKSREFHFPVEWVVKRDFDRIRLEMEQVHSSLRMLAYSNRGIGRDGRPDPYKDY